MELVLIWLGFAVIVGVAAGRRDRSGFGWFLLAVITSPLLAGLLLLALGPPKLAPPRVQITSGERRQSVPQPPSAAAAHAIDTSAPFEPEAVYVGIPYRVLSDGTIDALLAGGRVRFRNIEQFTAAATGGNSNATAAR